MNEETYNELKEKYIYSISKNGLITTKAIDKKSYLFRSENDTSYMTFLFLIGENNVMFLKMVLREARGMDLSFYDDIPLVPILEPLPDPEPLPDMKAEIKEIEEQLKKDNPDVELISPFYSTIYNSDEVPNWWK